MYCWLFVVLYLLSSVTACIYKNERFKDGDVWIVRSTFVMKCRITPRGWNTVITGCRTENGTVVAPGDTLKEKDTTYECLTTSTGRVEIRRTYDSILKNCEGKAIGETWVSQDSQNFRKVCTVKGIRIKECLSDSGISVALNSSLVLSGITYSCVEHANGTVTINREGIPNPSNFKNSNLRPVEVLGPMFKHLKTFGNLLQSGSDSAVEEKVAHQAEPITTTTIKPKEIRCITKTGTYKPEETWISENKFTKKCTSNGSVVILNCLIDDKTTINVNTEVHIGKTTYHCHRKDTEGRVYFEITPDEE